jgi:large subunit ribosomal protein L18
MKHTSKKTVARERRHKRSRRKVSGTPDRPRVVIYRSLKHIYAQVVDDTSGVVLTSASTLSPEVKPKLNSGKKKTEQSKMVGELLASKALDKGIKQVRFDRSGYIYHGRVKALADALREGGLEL